MKENIVYKLKRKIKMLFSDKYPDPLKCCDKAKNRECINIDGFLCPCEEMNKKEV